MFGHNLRYETKGTFGEISLKLCQTNWNVAINNVNVVADELPSQSTNKFTLILQLIFELDLNPNINAVSACHLSMAMNGRVVFNKSTSIYSDFF
jgi:hypothetical protein